MCIRTYSFVAILRNNFSDILCIITQNKFKRQLQFSYDFTLRIFLKYIPKIIRLNVENLANKIVGFHLKNYCIVLTYNVSPAAF